MLQPDYSLLPLLLPVPPLQIPALIVPSSGYHHIQGHLVLVGLGTSSSTEIQTGSLSSGKGDPIVEIRDRDSLCSTC